jgi:ammonium transporter, Amt family
MACCGWTDDATGVVTAHGIPAIVGLVLVGIFADGVAGSGWQMTGVESYLGVSGQGVSGLLVPRGYQIDFPGQLQAQFVGVLTLSLWGFLTGVLICTPLGLLFHGLKRSEAWQQSEVEPVLEANGFDLEQFEDDLFPLAPQERQERR